MPERSRLAGRSARCCGNIGRRHMLDDKADKIAILVAGMHRSGTSATTRVLNILGCTLPKTLSKAAPDNTMGFWESPAIKDLNDRILASAGSAWEDWEAFNSSWYASPVADGFREHAQTTLDDEFGDGRLFVLKDPRICRLLPFWIDAVRSFGAKPFIVSPIRNPLDVAASLEARDGIDPSIGLLMWLRYLLDAEAASRDLKRVYLRYERLLIEPHAVVDKLSDALGIAWPKRSTGTDMAIDEFLSPALHHHWNEDTDFLANPRLSHWLRSSFKILDRWACGKVQKRDTSALDRIRTAFDDATPAFGRAIGATLAERKSWVEGLSAELSATRATLAERKSWVEGLSAELSATRATLAERESRVEGLSAELNTSRAALAERESRVEGLSAELNTSRAALAERESRVEGLSAELNTSRAALAERESRVEGLSAELSATRAALAGRESRVEGLSTELSATRAALAERESRVEGLSAELNTSRAALAERENRVEGLSAELNTSRAALAERESRVEGLSAELSATRATLAEREERIVRLDTELFELRSSTSWQLTTPARYVGIHAKRAIRYMKFIFLILRTPGAIRKILQKIRLVSHQGGVAAIRQRLRLFFEDDAQSAQTTLSREDQRMEFFRSDAESGSDIFILSIINWNFRFQRPQHLAIEFARSGRRVFYIEMMFEPDELKIVKIHRNLYRVRLPAKEIGYIHPYTGKATEEQKMAWLEAFSFLCDSVEATSFKHIIIQHPFWWQMARSVPPEFQLVHDCMDHISGFSNTDRFVQDLEEEMISNCDTLIVSSEVLFNKYRDIKSPILVRNAADIEHFSSENEIDSVMFKQKLPSLEILHSDAGVPESETIKVGYVALLPNGLTPN